MTKRILLIQGANMEWLGKRQPELYGTVTAAELDQMVRDWAKARRLEIEIAYCNIEGEAISRIYDAARSRIDGLIINPASFHYAGHALADCLKGVRLPFVEVHMTNIDARGMRSVTAPVADAMITGLGVHSYELALDAMLRVLDRRGDGAE
jgi:3-dehydroquinate dehydratase-2